MIWFSRQTKNAIKPKYIQHIYPNKQIYFATLLLLVENQTTTSCCLKGNLAEEKETLLAAACKGNFNQTLCD